MRPFCAGTLLLVLLTNSVRAETTMEDVEQELHVTIDLIKSTNDKETRTNAIEFARELYRDTLNGTHTPDFAHNLAQQYNGSLRRQLEARQQLRDHEKQEAASNHVRRKVFGGPYYLKGWRPKEWTKAVTLTQGTYTLEGRHKGKGNFIVYMVSSSDKKLIFNDIDHSYGFEIVKVNEPTQSVRFLVKDAGGPWEINIKKSPEQTESPTDAGNSNEQAALWANSMRQAREREQALSHSRAEALAAARAKMEGKPDETGLIYILTNPAVPGRIRIGRTAGDVQHEVDELNKSVQFAYELHSITKVHQSRMIELAIRQFLSGAKDGAHYRVDPETAKQQLVKMAQENNAHRMINAGR